MNEENEALNSQLSCSSLQVSKGRVQSLNPESWASSPALPETQSLPLWGARCSIQPVCQTPSQHETKAAGWALGAEECESVAEENTRWGLWFHTVESKGRTPGMSYWRCGNSGNAEVLRETGRTNAALWPLAALESKECTTRMWSQMPDSFIILQGLKMNNNHYFTFF